MLSFSQEKLKGMVMITNEEHQVSGLPGASVYWLETTIGTTTNNEGWFEIDLSEKSNKLVVSYIGYQTDTLTVTSNKEFHLFLKPTLSLSEVEIKGTQNSTAILFFSPMNTITINESELLKAACCNLSESFETNPAVGVSYADAISGVKEIKMLGLTSPYILISQENIPSVRGASQVYGMSFIPGTWIESIQVTKGMGSVVNGFESISGQINTELKKPRNSNNFFANLYGSGSGRLELNTHILKNISDSWSTGLFVHTNHRQLKVDRNGDGFLDVPLGSQLNLLNRWQYANPTSGWVSFLDVKYVADATQIGSVAYNPEVDKFQGTEYGGEIDTKRFEFSTKLGYVFKDKPYQSIGFQSAYSNHNQDSYFGYNVYNIEQNSFYFNSIFQSILFNTMHTFKTGISVSYDGYKEQVLLDVYARNENSMGGFFEYTYDNIDNLTVVAGLRADYHSVMKYMITPRIHVRYEPWDSGVFKIAVGKGQRIASVFAENQKIFASSRTISMDDQGEGSYGLNPEIAWNYGLSYLHKTTLFGNSVSLSLDYFITDFSQQVIVDYDASPREVQFYNLNESSTAKSFQVELNYELHSLWDFRIAYQLNDVVIAYKKGALQKPLQPRETYFVNMGYQSKKIKDRQWKWDMTYNRVGAQRIPDTSQNPIAYQLEEFSNQTQLLHFQLTYVLSNNLEFYAGAENILDTTQKNPVLANDDPFGPYFDSTLVYAPVLGRMYYGGIRYNL
jgi:outer membrane receptor for ferrienterochelin and colicins